MKPSIATLSVVWWCLVFATVAGVAILSLTGCSTAGKVGDAADKTGVAVTKAEAVIDAVIEMKPVIERAVASIDRVATRADEIAPIVKEAVTDAKAITGWVRERRPIVDTAGWALGGGFLVTMTGMIVGFWRAWRRGEGLAAVARVVEENLPPEVRREFKTAMERRYGGCPVVRGEVRKAKHRRAPPAVPGVRA